MNIFKKNLFGYPVYNWLLLIIWAIFIIYYLTSTYLNHSTIAVDQEMLNPDRFVSYGEKTVVIASSIITVGIFIGAYIEKNSKN